MKLVGLLLLSVFGLSAATLGPEFVHNGIVYSVSEVLDNYVVYTVSDPTLNAANYEPIFAARRSVPQEETQDLTAYMPKPLKPVVELPEFKKCWPLTPAPTWPKNQPTPEVPEPNTWAMLASGVGLIALGKRR